MGLELSVKTMRCKHRGRGPHFMQSPTTSQYDALHTYSFIVRFKGNTIKCNFNQEVSIDFRCSISFSGDVIAGQQSKRRGGWVFVCKWQRLKKDIVRMD